MRLRNSLFTIIALAGLAACGSNNYGTGGGGVGGGGGGGGPAASLLPQALVRILAMNANTAIRVYRVTLRLRRCPLRE